MTYITIALICLLIVYAQGMTMSKKWRPVQTGAVQVFCILILLFHIFTYWEVK